MKKDSKSVNKKGKLYTFEPTGEYYFNKGLKSFQRGDYHKSIRYLKRALQLEPLEPTIMCQLAIAHSELEEFRPANQLLLTILDEIDPRMYECHYFLANNYIYMGLFKEAYTHATDYLNKDEDGEFVEEAEELLDMIMMDYDEPIESLYDQDHLMLKQEEARSLLEKGKFLEAASLLETVTAEYPEFWSGHNNLALAYFYMGKLAKTEEVLNHILEKNHGNLHALCNMAVLVHYQSRFKEAEDIVRGLKIIRPISYEQRYKLGATFALIGQYEEAYEWLKNLQKKGFEGDASFYYWLAYAGYHTSHLQTAKSAWKKVIESDPSKEGLEPWNRKKNSSNGESTEDVFFDFLSSDNVEEKMVALFILKLSKHQPEWISHEKFTNKEWAHPLEQAYLSDLIAMEVDDAIKDEAKVFAENLHLGALELYERHRPIHAHQKGLFLIWFSMGSRAFDRDEKWTNYKALAASCEYIWYKWKGEKRPKKEVAAKYGISSSTLTKYIQKAESYLS
jgi:tetratricopeptide (TPR) repeat protein